MRLILHIGMGKTGSSAIQAALSASKDLLRTQGVEYLGMWFDMVDKKFHGLQNQEMFFSLSKDEMGRAAAVLYDVMKNIELDRGASTFIISNEAFSGRAHALKPLIEGLMEKNVEVRAIGYVRDPVTWLPSAYVQWSIRDKVPPGPIQAYATRARQLVRWYSGLVAWGRLLGDITDIRSYDCATDIVADFGEGAGIRLELSGKRVLERGEDAEILMRALFNNRFQEHVLPNVFDHLIFRDSSEITIIEDMASKCFDYSETMDIVEENGELFDQFVELFHLDPRKTGKAPPHNPDISCIRARMLDYLTEIVFRQAIRIRHLEGRMEAFERASKTEKE